MIASDLLTESLVFPAGSNLSDDGVATPMHLVTSWTCERADSIFHGEEIALG